MITCDGVCLLSNNFYTTMPLHPFIKATAFVILPTRKYHDASHKNEMMFYPYDP
jgi:hypothetical protein